MIDPHTCTMDQWHSAKEEDKGGYCDHCATWCNPKREGAGDWGKASNKPWDYMVLFYCDKCVTNEGRKHKKLYR